MNRLEDTKPMAIKRPFCRAKIFQPFDALPGLRELLREKEREHERAFYQDAVNGTIANGKHSERCAFGSAKRGALDLRGCSVALRSSQPELICEAVKRISRFIAMTQ